MELSLGKPRSGEVMQWVLLKPVRSIRLKASSTYPDSLNPLSSILVQFNYYQSNIPVSLGAIGGYRVQVDSSLMKFCLTRVHIQDVDTGAEQHFGVEAIA